MVAIDMEMPKECYMCPLLDGEYGVCQIVGETKVDMTEERAKNCPLVEIITCKECKHHPQHSEWCRKHIRYASDNQLCMEGERRE